MHVIRSKVETGSGGSLQSQCLLFLSYSLHIFSCFSLVFMGFLVIEISVFVFSFSFLVFFFVARGRQISRLEERVRRFGLRSPGRERRQRGQPHRLHRRPGPELQPSGGHQQVGAQHTTHDTHSTLYTYPQRIEDSTRARIREDTYEQPLPGIINY